MSSHTTQFSPPTFPQGPGASTTAPATVTPATEGRTRRVRASTAAAAAAVLLGGLLAPSGALATPADANPADATPTTDVAAEPGPEHPAALPAPEGSTDSASDSSAEASDAAVPTGSALEAASSAGTDLQATVSEYYALPSDGVWRINGRGHGHGRGMSQWGAQGAALQGLSYHQILAFYYPGTGTRLIGNPTVRVLLEAPTTAGVVTFQPMAGAGAPMVTTKDGRQLQGPHLTVRYVNGEMIAEIRDTPGGVITAAGELPTGTVVRTDGGVLLGAGVAPRTATWYRGDVVLTTSNGFEVVNHLSMRHYLYGVVPREAPASWAPAALQAQAVAARTYEQAVALPTATHDLCDTTRCQVYGGRSQVTLATGAEIVGESATTNAAVDATEGVILTRSGTDTAAAFTQFSSSSGGQTVAGPASHPYLVSREDPYSGSAPGDTASVWSTTLAASEVAPYCPPTVTGRTDSPVGLEITGRDGIGAFGGRITSLVVHCTEGATRITRELDMRLGMKSSWWQPEGKPSLFYLSDTLGSDADRVFEYGPRGGTDVFVGDWDGDDVTGLGHREGNLLYLRNTPDAGPSLDPVPYGRPGDRILVGDWTGSGPETVAVRRGNVFHLKYSIGSGDADLAVPYGRPGDDVIIGDWDGDGIDTPGVRRGNVFHLKNSWTGGDADIVVHYGRVGDEIVVGDWNGAGKDTPAVRRGNIFYIQPDFVGGDATAVVAYGRATDRALVGDWNGDGIDGLGLHRLGY